MPHTSGRSPSRSSRQQDSTCEPPNYHARRRSAGERRRRDGVNQRHELGDVVAVAAGEDHRQRGAVPIRGQAMFRSGSAAIDRTRRPSRCRNRAPRTNAPRPATIAARVSAFLRSRNGSATRSGLLIVSSCAKILLTYLFLRYTSTMGTRRPAVRPGSPRCVPPAPATLSDNALQPAGFKARDPASAASCPRRADCGSSTHDQHKSSLACDRGRSNSSLSGNRLKGCPPFAVRLVEGS